MTQATKPAAKTAAPADPYLPSDPDAAKAYKAALTLAQSAIRKGENARLEPGTCEAAIALLAQDWKDHPEWVAELADRDFGAAHWAALGAAVPAYRAATDAVPLSWRTFEQLTPAQKDRVKAIAKVLASFKNAVTIKAKRTVGVGAVGVLGRGLTINAGSAASVHSGLVKFITGAERRAELLADAKVTAADLQKLMKMRDELAAYPTVKGQRGQLKSTLAEKVDLYGVLVEVLFDELRVAASTAFAEDAVTYEKIVMRLPRAPERRSKPKPSDEEPPPA